LNFGSLARETNIAAVIHTRRYRDMSVSIVNLFTHDQNLSSESDQRQRYPGNHAYWKRNGHDDRCNDRNLQAGFEHQRLSQNRCVTSMGEDAGVCNLDCNLT
jgi:hypothetical protein